MLLRGSESFEIFYVLRGCNVNILGMSWLRHMSAVLDLGKGMLHLPEPAMSIALSAFTIPQPEDGDQAMLIVALAVAHSSEWTTPQADGPPRAAKVLRPTEKRPKLQLPTREADRQRDDDDDATTISGASCRSVLSVGARSAIFPPPSAAIDDTCVVGAGLNPKVVEEVETGAQRSLCLDKAPADVAESVGSAASDGASTVTPSPTSDYPPRVEKAVNPELPPETRKQYLDLLMTHRDVWEHPKVGTCTVAEHHIYIKPNTHPFCERARKQSPAMQQEIFKQLEELVKVKAIAPCTSNWASNVVLVPKKEGVWRMCIDYRRLNGVTINDAYPMQRLDDALRALEGASVFCVVDMKSGFHQMKMAEASKDYTAFITPFGLFVALVMMFGLKNAPKSFQRMVDRIFHDLRFRGVGAYMDDVVIYADSHDEVLLLLATVFSRFRNGGLFGNIDKMHLGYFRFAYLGFIIDGAGVHTDPSKVGAIRQLRPPQTTTEIKRFLGAVGFFRKFIRNFGDKAQPLNQLLKKGTQWRWGESQAKAWQALKDDLCSEPIVLAHPNPDWPYCLRTDASHFAVSAALTQIAPDGKVHVISYAAHSLTDNERIWPSRELEAFAIFWGITHFAPYLRGLPEFSVRTDHESLEQLWTQDHKRLARWRIALSDYNFVVHYQKGSTNHLADMLSRDCTEIITEDAIDKRITLSPHVFLLLHSPQLIEPERESDDESDCSATSPPPPSCHHRRRSSASHLYRLVRADELDTQARPSLSRAHPYETPSWLDPNPHTDITAALPNTESCVAADLPAESPPPYAAMYISNRRCDQCGDEYWRLTAPVLSFGFGPRTASTEAPSEAASDVYSGEEMSDTVARAVGEELVGQGSARECDCVHVVHGSDGARGLCSSSSAVAHLHNDRALASESQQAGLSLRQGEAARTYTSAVPTITTTSPTNVTCVVPLSVPSTAAGANGPAALALPRGRPLPAVPPRVFASSCRSGASVVATCVRPPRGVWELGSSQTSVPGGGVPLTQRSQSRYDYIHRRQREGTGEGDGDWDAAPALRDAHVAIWAKQRLPAWRELQTRRPRSAFTSSHSGAKKKWWGSACEIQSQHCRRARAARPKCVPPVTNHSFPLSASGPLTPQLQVIQDENDAKLAKWLKQSSDAVVPVSQPSLLDPPLHEVQEPTGYYALSGTARGTSRPAASLAVPCCALHASTPVVPVPQLHSLPTRPLSSPCSLPVRHRSSSCPDLWAPRRRDFSDEEGLAEVVERSADVNRNEIEKEQEREGEAVLRKLGLECHGGMWQTTKGQVYIPASLRKAFLFYFHFGRWGCHLTVERMLHRAQLVCWWPCMRESMRRYAKSCLVCMRQTPHRRKPTLGRLGTNRPGKIVAIDGYGPLMYKGVQYLGVTMIDHFSRNADAPCLLFLLGCLPRCAGRGRRW
eukprot:GHVU01045154.1.p1 GENE.GHVU01045154.1~~GHVU01045154.1.p1  ORF type:complete len:1425 (+),score=108.03 GHVU01045154.1:1406-5680(+)